MNRKSSLPAGLLLALLIGSMTLSAVGKAAASQPAFAPLPGVETSAPQGQPPPGGPRMGRGQLSVASVPLNVLDANLKLSADQKTNIQKIQDKYAEDRKALMPPPPDPSGPPPDLQALRENFQKMRDSEQKASKDIEAQLTDDQKKQLPDLLKEVGLYRSVNMPPELIPDLKLTADQKKQLADIARESQDGMRQKLRDAMQSGGFQAARDVAIKARQDTYEKALTVLTPDQKDKTVAYVKAHPQRDGGMVGPFGGFGGPPGPPPGGTQ